MGKSDTPQMLAILFYPHMLILPFIVEKDLVSQTNFWNCEDAKLAFNKR